ncbi:MAG TPA: hypothetical protein VIL55_09410 [Naasia sp.]|jgi:hypothetical protein
MSAVPAPLDVVRLHLSKRYSMFVVPLFIVAGVFVVTAVIALAFQRLAAGADMADAIDGARQNPAVAWALSGFMVALGVQGVATAFPFSLALGTTRRTFTLGTLLTNGLIAVYVTAIFLALLGLELLTNHWFVGIHLVDVYILGAADPLQLAVIVFLGALTLLSAGSAFGAAWTRFGPTGAAVLGMGLGLLLALALLLLAPSLPDIAASFRAWWLAVAAGILIVAASLGTLLFLRGASVR